MLQHIKHVHYTDLVLCPQTHQYEAFRSLTGDEEPAMELCTGCNDLFDASAAVEVSV